MSDHAFTTCAYCPRLCRHVCPVASATGREAATAASMMTAALLAERGVLDSAFGIAGTSLCLGCGACTTHCKLHVPVSERLREWRAPHVDVVRPDVLEAIDGPAPTVCLISGDRDWSGAWGRAEQRAVARLRTRDSLGHAAWKLGATDVPDGVASHLRGREVVTDSRAAAEVLAAAAVPVRLLPAPAAGTVFRTCYESSADSAYPTPGLHQLACCGRREGFSTREPESAHAVAEENARLLGPGRVACADEECACWLRAHGVDVAGPTSEFGD